MRDRDNGRFGEYVGGIVLGVGMVVPFALTLAEFDYFWIANAIYLGVRRSGLRRHSREARRLSTGHSSRWASRPGSPTRSGVCASTHGEMTQAELAQQVGVTRQTIIAIEQGRYSPSLEMAFQIANAFNVPLDEVFQYQDTEGADT